MNERVKTTCTMDCPDSCALEVEVGEGRVQAIRGSHDHPNTAGFICDKVAQYGKRLYHPDRVLYPMRRVGRKGEGKFERVSWYDAILEITQKFKGISAQWGSEAILPYHYGGSNGLLGEQGLDDYFFARLGASQIEKTLCAAPTTAVATGMYGKMPGVAFEDYEHAKFILIWGANPKASNIHLVPYLKRAKQKGAFIAVVDPSRNFSTSEIDLHLPVLPGTDLPLALSLIREWKSKSQFANDFLNSHSEGLGLLLEASQAWDVERAADTCGVSPNDIRKLAEKYFESSPAVLRCGWGLERNKNGGQAIAAILAMPALLGKFGVRGGGYTLSNSGAIKVDTRAIFGDFPWKSRKLNMTQLGLQLTGNLDPPVKALYVYNCNPVATVPDQNTLLRGLAREDLFVVVHEQVKTDTAMYADLLLPAPTFLEQKEIKRAYGTYTVGGVQPVVKAMGQARPNEAVFAELGRAMGWSDPPFSWNTDQYMEKYASALSLNGIRVSREKLLNGQSQGFDFPGSSPIQFETVFPLTHERKIQLAPSVLGPKPYHYEPVITKSFPLALISPATSKMISSTFGEFNYSHLQLTLHPEDAHARKLESGDTVRVFNELGDVVCTVRTDEKIRKGVAMLPKGAWLKSSKNQRTSTALSPSHVNDVGGGACFNDARVEVEKCKEH